MASIQKRTSPIKCAHLADKSEKGSISNLSTKADADGGAETEPCAPAEETFSGYQIYRFRTLQRQYCLAAVVDIEEIVSRAVFMDPGGRSVGISANFGRLVLGRLLQPNTKYSLVKAFFEIYKICTPSRRSTFKIFANIRQIFSFLKTIFIDFCADFDIFSEFRGTF